jgi:hypothetical protein
MLMDDALPEFKLLVSSIADPLTCPTAGEKRRLSSTAVAALREWEPREDSVIQISRQETLELMTE